MIDKIKPFAVFLFKVWLASVVINFVSMQFPAVSDFINNPLGLDRTKKP